MNLPILVARGDGDIYVFDATDREAAALKLVSLYMHFGYYYECESRAEAILATKNGAAALAFIQERTAFEYEGIEFKETM